MTQSIPHLAVLGQVIFFSLAIAVALLFIGVIFTRRRAPDRPAWQQAATLVNAGGAFSRAGAADRLSVLGVALGCGAVQWAFWQGMLQGATGFPAPAQDTNALYAPLLSLGVGYTVMGLSLLTTALVVLSGLIHVSQIYPRIEGLVKFLDRVTVLGVASISLLLVNFFGARGGWLANTLAFGSAASADVSGAPAQQVTLHYSLFLFSLIALFGVVALLRLRREIGRAERLLLLLCGAGAMLMLTDTPDVQHLPLLSVNVQQAAGNFVSSVNADQVVALALLVAALLSFAWLLSTTIVSDRLALGIIFGMVALLALLAALSAQQWPVILACIIMIQGVLIAAKVERVRRGNTPYAQP